MPGQPEGAADLAGDRPLTFNVVQRDGMKTYLTLIDTCTHGPRHDVTPLFADRRAFALLVKDLSAPFPKLKVDGVACIDALGFILGTAIALELGTRIVPLRKNGKLPVPTDKTTFRDYFSTNPGVQDQAASKMLVGENQPDPDTGGRARREASRQSNAGGTRSSDRGLE